MVPAVYSRMFLHTLIKIIETKDPYTVSHQYRVADLACRIAEIMEMNPCEREGLRWAARVHDLGKIFVPAEILSKPDPIAAVELQLVQVHVATGYDILKEISFPWPLAQIVLEHHERLDGTGYPAGLSGSQISLAAKILAVADTVEAMASHRPYRAAPGLEKAMDEIVAKRGVHYQPAVVDACMRLFQEQHYHFPDVQSNGCSLTVIPIPGESCFKKSQGLKASNGAL